MTFLADRVTNVPVPFRQLRMKDAEGTLQEGVVGANDLKIVQRGAGANQSVDFSVGAGHIQIDSGTRSGLVHFYNDAVANVAVTASNATNPRIDQAIVRYNDTSIPAGTGGNTPTPEILAGTATAGATLDNRTGAAALPNDCLRLADILVPATSTSVVTANIRDRRPWARGAFMANSRGAVTLPITTNAELDTTNWKQRIECNSISAIRLGLFPAAATLIAGNAATLQFWFDGAPLSTQSATNNTASNLIVPMGWFYTVVLAAGSHVFSVAGSYTGGASAASIAASVFTVEEVVRPVGVNT